MEATIDQVKTFWNSNPLWTGESEFAPGSPDFFAEHYSVVVGDCFAGRLDERIFPVGEKRSRVLDLGCGPGFWTLELLKRGCGQVTAADIAPAALELARQRCHLHGFKPAFSEENAEQLSFPDATFTHVNCQGVIHHAPDTARCVSEIARVLEPGGTASISVYFRNVFLRAWPLIRPVGKVLSGLNSGLKGRGREKIFAVDDIDEIVRLYDGKDNPVGKSYTRKQFVEMLSPYFEVNETFLHFFPARALPFAIGKTMHQLLDAKVGFLIYANLTKK